MDVNNDLDFIKYDRYFNLISKTRPEKVTALNTALFSLNYSTLTTIYEDDLIVFSLKIKTFKKDAPLVKYTYDLNDKLISEVELFTVQLLSASYTRNNIIFSKSDDNELITIGIFDERVKKGVIPAQIIDINLKSKKQDGKEIYINVSEEYKSVDVLNYQVTNENIKIINIENRSGKDFTFYKNHLTVLSEKNEILYNNSTANDDNHLINLNFKYPLAEIFFLRKYC